jgi:hypothetical protein
MNNQTLVASTSAASGPGAIPPCRNGGIPHHHCGICGRPTSHTICGYWQGRNIKALCSRCSESSSAHMRERIKAEERRLWCTIVGDEGKEIG